MRSTRRRGFGHVVNCDLELRPLMNVFIVLIPMLLMSAVFMEIRIIEMNLPGTADAATPPPAEAFDLAIRILPDAYVVEQNGVEIQAVPRLPNAGPVVTAAQLAHADSHPLTRLLAQIAAAHPGAHEVRIVAGHATRYQEIVTVMDLARAAGLSQAALEGAEEAP